MHGVGLQTSGPATNGTSTEAEPDAVAVKLAVKLAPEDALDTRDRTFSSEMCDAGPLGVVPAVGGDTSLERVDLVTFPCTVGDEQPATQSAVAIATATEPYFTALPPGTAPTRSSTDEETMSLPNHDADHLRSVRTARDGFVHPVAAFRPLTPGRGEALHGGLWNSLVP